MVIYGTPGGFFGSRESNRDHWGGNPVHNLLDHPDSLVLSTDNSPKHLTYYNVGKEKNLLFGLNIQTSFIDIEYEWFFKKGQKNIDRDWLKIPMEV